MIMIGADGGAVREGIPDGNRALSVPGAKGPGIHVNEIGAGIVTDTTQFEVFSRITE